MVLFFLGQITASNSIGNENDEDFSKFVVVRPSNNRNIQFIRYQLQTYLLIAAEIRSQLATSLAYNIMSASITDIC